MKRDEAVIKLRSARKELKEVLAGIGEEDLVRPNAVEKWTLKDLLGHIAAWDEETIRIIQAFAMQAEPHFSYSISDRNGFAVWNNEQVQQRKDRTVAQIVSEFDNARRDLIQVVEGITDQVLMRPKQTPWNALRTGLELIDETADHDLEHAADIRSWRKKRERWARAREKYVNKRRESKKKTHKEESEPD